jgi:NTP pyrophosphatase (non-canonical NTP hydrolase)
MQHFNQLTPAQVERLALLAEEMGEAAQVIGKILRHGMDSSNPLDPAGATNRTLLEKELGDVRHAVKRLCEAGDIQGIAILKHADKKAVSVTRWLHHQADEPHQP